MAFLHRLVELKLNNQTYSTDTESGVEWDNRSFENASVAVNGGVQVTQAARLPSLSNITLKGIDKDQLAALNEVNDNPIGYSVVFTLAEQSGDVSYSGTVNIEGELTHNSQAGTVTLNLMSADGQPFVEI